MMYYWPLQTMLENPLLTDKNKRELKLACIGIPLSQETMETCLKVAMHVNGFSSMVLVRSEGAPSRRVYLTRPTDEEWNSLERAGFVATHSGFGFTMDALH